MAYSLAQASSRPDVAVTVARRALDIVAETEKGPSLELFSARAVLASAMHSSGDCAGAIREYQ